MECRSRNFGDYVSKYTMHERMEGEEKPAVRPISIERSAFSLFTSLVRNAWRLLHRVSCKVPVRRTPDQWTVGVVPGSAALPMHM